MTDQELAHRRAIEALRAGVPNRDAVRALGCSQPHIEEKFREQLLVCSENAAKGKQAHGMIVAGDFGSGKSHLLEHLHHLALEQNYISSKIVISKETPLYDPTKFYRAAIDAAVVPNKQGSALREITQVLDKADGYPKFYQHITSDRSEFNSLFAATLQIYEYVRIKDIDWRDKVISFWSGHKLNVSELKKYLRQSGEGATYKIEKISSRELALQRFKFASRLMMTAGYSGWILLVDEAELIGRYSLLQRARSYAELARWMGNLKGEIFPGLLAVFTITPDFERDILLEKNDLNKIPARLSAREQENERLLSAQADCGMRAIQKIENHFKPLDSEQIGAIGEKLREVHSQAYCWNPPPARYTGESSTSTRLRTYVRAWINQWDIERLYPNYSAEIQATELQQTHTEDPDLEVASEPDEDDEKTQD